MITVVMLATGLLIANLFFGGSWYEWVSLLIAVAVLVVVVWRQLRLQRMRGDRYRWRARALFFVPWIAVTLSGGFWLPERWIWPFVIAMILALVIARSVIIASEDSE